MRDLIAAGEAVAESKENAGWQLALSMVAVVPGVGDAVKAVGKAALGGAAILGTAALKHGDDLAELGEGLARRLTGAIPPETLARLGEKLGPAGLEALARGMDVETLARVTASVDADTLTALVAKGLDGHTIRELADGMSSVELKALAESGSADELAAAASRLSRERLSGAAAALRETYLKGRPAPHGGNAAAAELTLDDGTRLSSEATSKKAPMDAPRTRAQGADPVTGKGGHYEPTTHADETWVRSPDSEFKILTDLTDQLLAAGQQAPTGRLTLYTEMVPCGSCAAVLRQFQERFPGIQLQVLYDFSSKGGSP